MKHLLLAFSFLVFTLAVTAQSRRALMKVRLSDNAPIMLQIDDRYYEEEAPVVTVGNITPGRHRLRVYRANKRGFTRNALLYDGTIRIEPGASHMVVVDRARRIARVSTRSLLGEGRGPNMPPAEKRDVKGDRNAPLPHSDGLPSNEMEQLRKSVAERITDTDRLKLLKTTLEKRKFNTAQVQTIMGWLNFESSKIEFCQWAYPFVTDRQNYSKLESEFNFESTKSEFQEFIRAAR